jgi:hypothetical protein
MRIWSSGAGVIDGGVSLRWGFFYGPNTWYDPDGGASDEVRKQLFR